MCTDYPDNVYKLVCDRVKLYTNKCDKIIRDNALNSFPDEPFVAYLSSQESAANAIFGLKAIEFKKHVAGVITDACVNTLKLPHFSEKHDLFNLIQTNWDADVKDPKRRTQK